MHLKRFYAPSVREALGQVRAELGHDALVVSTKLVAAPGCRGWLGSRQVEVTAALERQVSEPRPEPQPERHLAPVSEDLGGTVAMLIAAGLDPVLAADVAALIPGSRRRSPSLATVQKVLAKELDDLTDPSRGYAPIEVFVGPPGAGKTTTIAKIASQERARHGVRLGLVAADGFRVGAVEQLRLYADIIGAPFTVARAAGDLETAMARTKRPILVDTAGRSPGDRASQELFQQMAAHPDVRTHLVLAAGTSPRDAERILDRYADARPARVVLTKLDETHSISPIVSVLRARRLPISYLGTGQRVPEDLYRATGQLLAACLLGETAVAMGIPA